MRKSATRLLPHRPHPKRLGEACSQAGPIDNKMCRLIKLSLAVGAGSEGRLSHASVGDRYYGASAIIRLKKHGHKDETEASITNKLARGTFPTAFFLACLAALELDGVALEEI